MINTAASGRIRLTVKPVDAFNTDDIKRIRRQTGLSQVIFAYSLGVSPKTVEAWGKRQEQAGGGFPPPP